jgi:DNA-binding response OmpR family regulator
MEANAKGLDVELVVQCRQACRSHTEFLEGLRQLISEVPARKRRVLAVDDEADFLALLKANLERSRRYEVAALTDPSEFERTAIEFRPDLVLLDVVMPGRDGLELLAALRGDERLRATPVIMLTALAHGSTGGGVAKDGVLYLSKPVKMKRLVHCIEEHIEASARGGLRVLERDGGGDQ